MPRQKGPIRVVHFGLGPIGAGVVRQVAARKGFKIVGAVDIDPAQGRAGSRRHRRRRPPAQSEGIRRRQEDDQGGEAGRRRAVHELVDEGGARPDRVDPEAAACRSSPRPRSSPIRPKRNMRYARIDPRAGEEGEGGGARHRRQSRLRDGRAADHADRRLRAGRGHPRRPHPGRAHPPAAVPAEDRRRADARTVPEEGRRWQRAPRRAGRVGLDDCRRARLEARSHHRRDPAEDRRPRPSPANSSPSMPATSAASSRTASATAAASR